MFMQAPSIGLFLLQMLTKAPQIDYKNIYYIVMEFECSQCNAKCKIL